MSRRLAFTALAAILFGVAALFGTAARAEAPTQNEVESSLTCQCGCGLTVHSCNHVNCGSAIPLKKEIGEQISAGRSLPEILSHFEETYGEVVLAAPTTRGFNLAAWVMPFVVLGIGGLVVAVVLRRWRTGETAAGPAVSGVPSGPESGANDELRARLERELQERDT